MLLLGLAGRSFRGKSRTYIAQPLSTLHAHTTSASSHLLCHSTPAYFADPILDVRPCTEILQATMNLAGIKVDKDAFVARMKLRFGEHPILTLQTAGENRFLAH